MLRRIILTINFIEAREMKIQNTIQIKWQFQLPNDEKHIVKIKNRGRKQQKSPSFGNIFGLPQSILQQPKLSEIKMMIKDKNHSFKQFLQQNQHSQHSKYFNNSLRNTLTNRVKQLLSPPKKQKRSLQALNSRTNDNQQDKRSQKDKKDSLSLQKPKDNVISLLQKIIFQQTIYKPKQKVIIALQANKLPTIDSNDAKRKQLLAPYQQQSSPTKAKAIKRDTAKRRSFRNETKRQKEPYFSGWDITQTGDF